VSENGERAVRPARRLAWRGLQIGLLALVAYGLYRTVARDLEGVGFAELMRWQPAGLPLVASTLMLVGVYVSHAFLWRRIMMDLKIGAPPARATVRIYFLASLGRYIPGRLWQLAGLAVLSQRAGLPAGRAAAAAVLGQIAFLGTGMIFLAAMLPGGPAGDAAWLAAGALLALALGTFLLLTSTAAERLRGRLRQALGEGSVARKFDAAFALSSRIRPAYALAWGAMYAATWLLLGIAFAVFASAFVPDSLGEARHLGGSVAAAYLAGYIAVFAPAGLLVRELALAALLGEVMPAAAALVVAVASRLWFTAAELLPLALLPLAPGDPS
jgi:glycosyltransferase 2 family protein